MNGGVLLAIVLLGSPHTEASPCAGASVRRCVAVQQVESLVVAGQRLAQAWARHDFEAVTGTGGDVLLLLPGATGPSSLRAIQAAQLLRGFTAGSDEVAVEVVVARDVDRERAYVEVQRVFVVRGTAGRRSQTIYFGLRRQGSGYRLYEVRIVP